MSLTMDREFSMDQDFIILPRADLLWLDATFSKEEIWEVVRRLPQEGAGT
jgi:hypothetical protein